MSGNCSLSCRANLYVVDSAGVASAVLLLIVGEALSHMVQNIACELLGLRAGHVSAEPLRVQAHLVHTDQADRGEVIAESSQISLRVRIQAVLEELCDNSSLGLKTAGRDIHQLIQSLVEVVLIRRKVSDAGHIDRNYADGACGLAGAKEAAGFLAQLSQVKAQSAAHGADIAGLHVRVDVVGEIGRAIFCRHLEQELIVLGLFPVKISGNGVSGDRILESSSVGVAFDHDLDEGLVHHIHFLLAVATLENGACVPHLLGVFTP